jgi:transposase
MKAAPKIILTEAERLKLEFLARRRTVSVRLAQRALIVLKAASGMMNKDIARELGIEPNTVVRWRGRFARERFAGIEKDRPRSGRRREQGNILAQRIIVATTQTKPSNATHWSTRTLAKHLGMDDNRVQRVWKAAGLKPHLFRTFKVSNDPRFSEKVVDVVGLYTNPPENAIVLCVDEKSQIQALDRTQKGLPLYRGRCGTMTHDYKRNGTTTLFAALNVLDGTVIGTCMQQHRHQEWLKFLKQIDGQMAQDKELHLVVDNYATHKHPRVLTWLKKHPRFHIHFTPTSSSWLNLIERWFRDLTQKRIRRGSFHSVRAVIDAVMQYIETHNDDSKPYLWTARAVDIIAKVRRARAVLENVQQSGALH